MCGARHHVGMEHPMKLLNVLLAASIVVVLGVVFIYNFNDILAAVT
jgi:hypothetical protein